MLWCFLWSKVRSNIHSGLECTGTEKSLLNYSWNALDGEYCRHYEDAGVACQGNSSHYSIIACVVDYYHFYRVISSNSRSQVWLHIWW